MSNPNQNNPNQNHGQQQNGKEQLDAAVASANTFSGGFQAIATS
jgi:hypothetical protein